jgi:hypothetical protein
MLSFIFCFPLYPVILKLGDTFHPQHSTADVLAAFTVGIYSVLNQWLEIRALCKRNCVVSAALLETSLLLRLHIWHY